MSFGEGDFFLFFVVFGELVTTLSPQHFTITIGRLLW